MSIPSVTETQGSNQKSSTAGCPPFPPESGELEKIERRLARATAALAKARKENPEGFEAYQDTDTTIVGEVIAKSGKHPFETEVDNIMSTDGCSRSVAMSRARKKHPVKYAAYQGL